MPSHTETRILPYSREQMFDLVMDIRRYPEFLPWCVGARVNRETRGMVEADVLIGYRIFREKFSSTVHIRRPSEIEVEYRKGPMRELHNTWVFRDAGPGKCEINFDISFTMQNKFLGKLVEQFFHQALAKMIDAFEKRAENLYGPPAPLPPMRNGRR